MRAFRSTLLLTLAAAVAGAADLAAVVQKSSVVVYSAPRLDAARLATLPHNTSVRIVAQEGLWYRLALADGNAGFVRVNDLRVAYGSVESGDANARVLLNGRSGTSHITETAGVRGIDESELRSASMDQEQLDAMNGYRADADSAARYAADHAWRPTQVPFDGEAKPLRDRPAPAADADTDVDADAVGDAPSVPGGLSFLGGFGSIVDTVKKVAPKPEQQQAAEELALGPQVAGRVLGARPLWNDAPAQQRVNLVGRWVASQTSRPDLPWTFGVIDTPEVNAFAAPGGYILVTRGMYELLGSDPELAAVLGHEISHCVQRDHYNVIHKQQVASLGKDALSSRVRTGSGAAESYARAYVEEHGATIVLTSLDRDAEYRADMAAEIYLARSGMNPIALYSILQKMTALGEQSAALAALYKTHPSLRARLDRIDARGYRGLQAYTTRD